MHTTEVIMKDGRSFSGTLFSFRPERGYLELVGLGRFNFDEIVSAITSDDRFGPEDELARAKEYLKDARRNNWHGDLPIQKFELE